MPVCKRQAPICNRRGRAAWRILALCAVGLAPRLALGQIITDGTVGPRATLSGPAMTIGAELGTTKGANLFHSFQDFNIQAGETATFTGPSQIQNVIGRVTGGQASSIDGTLRSTVGRADVYLVNPSGVVLGPNARIDVPAALHVSTADELRFQDGARFSAREPSASTLTVAAPEAFGFLAPQPAGIALAGSQLTVQPGKAMTLTARDVTIAGTAEQRASLRAPGGTVRVEAVGAGGGAVPVAEPSAAPGAGTLTIQQADLETSGDGGGLIALRAGAATLTDAGLVAENQGPTDAVGGIDLGVAGRLTLDRGWLYADTTASGRSGMARIQAGEAWIDATAITTDSYRLGDDSGVDPIGDAGGVTLAVAGSLGIGNGTLVSSRAFAEGAAGAVRIDVGEGLDVRGGAAVLSDTHAAGAAGTVTIHAGAARIDGAGAASFTGIASRTTPGATGAAGEVTLTIAGLLEVLNGAEITSSTWSSGDAGSVRVAAGAARLASGGAAQSSTGILSQANSGSTGAAGDIALEIAGLLEVLDGAEISSGTWSSGDAGSVHVQAGTARLDRAGADWPTGIWSDVNPGATGAGGAIRLDIADWLEVVNGAEISSNTWSSGNAGSVQVTAGSARIDGGGVATFTGIASLTVPGATGAAGDVTLEIADQLAVLGGAEIASSTFSDGAAGTVVARAGSIRLDRAGASRFTGIESQSNPGATAAAGDVILETEGLLEVLNGAQVSSSTFTAGDAGSVRIGAGRIYMDRGDSGRFTGIASQVNQGTGSGGDLILDIADRLEIVHGALISTATLGAGDAGTVTVRAGGATMDGRGSDLFTGIANLAASGSTGQAGDINLEIGGPLEMRDGAQISSSTWAAGDAGTVTVQAASARLLGASASGPSGIGSSADDGTGQGGNVILTIAGLLELSDEAQISSSTWAAGDAGTVRVRADELQIRGSDAGSLVTGIFSAALPTAAGRAGDIQIDARVLGLRQGGEISIAANQSAPAAADAAGAMIRIHADETRLETGSRVTTASTATDAGAIRIDGGWLWLQDSQITTSAEGATGDGGDIVLAPKQLILDGGFVQANTAASGARGGDIRIDSAVLIASQGQVAIGGIERQDFVPGSGANVIQAAAPGGESGTIAVTAPAFDISASVTPLAAPFANPDDLLADACRDARGTRPSRLIEGTTAGFPADAAGVSLTGRRLKRL